MKEEFYVHGTTDIINLREEAEVLKKDWGLKDKIKYPEGVTYYEIYNRTDYFRKSCTIKPFDIVVDCGGNIGIFTSIAFDMGAARVLSFEPFYKNYTLNKKNNPNAEVFCLAVTNESDDEVELYIETGNGGHTIIESEINNTLHPGHYERKGIYINTINLDDIISRNFLDHIDFLKIDTEGSELQILEGLSDENLNKIRCISLEYHSSVFNYDEDVYTKFIQRFLNLGFNTHTWIMDKHTRMLYVCKGDI